MGVGTTTPRWALQIASSTGGQLTLSDPSVLTDNHWTFRNAGGLFYLATSSASTFATSSASIFSINANGIPSFSSLGGQVGCAQFSSTGQLSNTETSTSNRFMAVMLDFLASGGGAAKVVPGGASALIPFNVTPEAGSAVMNYRVKIENIGGVTALCDALSVTVQGGTPFAYTGSLAGLDGTAVGPIAMTLEVSLPTDPLVLPDDECTFDIVVRAWHQFAPENTGYRDEERVSVVITDPPAETFEASVELFQTASFTIEEEETPTEEPSVEEVVEVPVLEEESVEETLPVEPEPTTEPEPATEPPPSPEASAGEAEPATEPEPVL